MILVNKMFRPIQYTLTLLTPSYLTVILLLKPQQADDNDEASRPQLTRTICFCCEDSATGRSGDIRTDPVSETGANRKKRNALPRTGRTIKIENPRQSARVYRHQSFIRKSLNCIEQVKPCSFPLGAGLIQ